MKTRLLAAASGAAIALALSLSQPAIAQSQDGVPAPPTYPSVDGQGVDVTSGQLVINDVDASVGDPESGLSRAFLGTGLRDNQSVTLAFDGYGHARVSVGGKSVEFEMGTNGWVRSSQEPETLEPTSNGYLFIDRDGTEVWFDSQWGSAARGLPQGMMATLIRKPNREEITFHYDRYATCSIPNMCARLRAVTSSLGYMLKYEYLTGTVDAALTLSRVVAINLAHEKCAPLASSCSVSTAPSETTFTGSPRDDGVVTSTDSLGRSTVYTYTEGRITRIQRPGNVVTDVSYGPDGKVATLSTATGTWTYNYEFASPGSADLRLTVTDPNNNTRTYVIDDKWKRIKEATNGEGHTTRFEIDPDRGLITKVINPEGDGAVYGYWGPRGNLSHIRKFGKSGQYGPQDHITDLGYSADCNSRKICNKPAYVIEGGSRTDFAYDPQHGGTTQVTAPPRGPSAVRPVTTFEYSMKSASFYDAAGNRVTGQGVFRLERQRSCITGTTPEAGLQDSCAGTADESVLEYEYDPSNNLQRSSEVVRAGDSSVSARRDFSYSRQGDLIAVNGPANGAADTERWIFNRERQLIATVSADPDGEGTGRPAVARRIGYTPWGEVQFIEQGTVAGASGWSGDQTGFTRVNSRNWSYDIAGRISHKFQRAYASNQATDVSLAQYSYDAGGRLECATVRMNPAAFASAPASACNPGAAGAQGPDRITRYDYTKANQVKQVTEGVSTADVRYVSRTSFSPNGRLRTFADGNGNLTTYEYDHYDRLAKTRYPDKASGQTSSTTDYEALAYDPVSWRESQRTRRDGSNMTFSYDAQGNILSTNFPMPTSYNYDNAGRLLTASTPSETVSQRHDALGRLVSSSSRSGEVRYEYDGSGRRRLLKWPDGFSVTYDYNAADELTWIWQEGATPLARFDYDDLGRRRLLTYSNGSTVTYGYDELSRLTSLAIDAPGASADLQRTLTYNAAHELTGRTNSNSAFALRDRLNSRSSPVNPLNQVTSVNGGAFTYGPRGNLAHDGTISYTYSNTDQLIFAGSALSLEYDPLDRLNKMSSPSSESRYVYDDVDIIGEYNGAGALVRRYIHGPGTDEPLISLEQGKQVLLIADERGSIIGNIDTATGTTAINSYDEYGVPGAGNVGTYQYTGQIRIPNYLLYHYKNRVYAPGIGRFMQPDPLGYSGNFNLYGYVSADPVNSRDPLGLEEDQNEISKTLQELIVQGERLSDRLEPRFQDFTQAVTETAIKVYEGGAEIVSGCLDGGCGPAGAGAGMAVGKTAAVATKLMVILGGKRGIPVPKMVGAGKSLASKLEKHWVRPSSVFYRQVTGNAAAKEAEAKRVYDYLLTKGTRYETWNPKYSYIIEYKVPGEGGLRFQAADGAFIGFIEP